MQAKLALSFATAALILAAGGFLVLLQRLNALGEERGEEPRGRPPGVVLASDPAEEEAGARNPLESRDPLVKLDHLIRRLEEIDANEYDYYSDISQDLFALKREVRHLKSTFKLILQGLGRGPGGLPQIGWGLAPADAPLTEEVLTAYREAAEKMGVRVEDGRVTVRGFLNLSPNTSMPIEYFITRFPESSHETLVHLLGNKALEDLAENPYLGLKGLGTALYKGLVAAGFESGAPTHPDPNSDPKNPEWILASGDVVYVAVRYVHGGKTHIARATDWILDPAAEAVLPPDCFRFTGSTRGEDPDTGDDVLAAEAMGLLVSVWPTYTALVEVALRSSLRNDYTYNFARIPKPTGEKPLYLDVIFSKTPVDPEGDGAKPLARPPAGDTGDLYPDEDAEEQR